MKVRIIDNGSYVNLDHIVGKVYDAVKVSGNYSGYYVDVPISSKKNTSLYFLPYEVEEVTDCEMFPKNYESAMAFASISAILIAIILVIVAICNQIIN
jgi:hypothetical protein